MCEKHYLMPIDVTCEDCEEFICSTCVKESHKDHNWQTIITAATLTRRGLLKSMSKIEEEDIKHMYEEIQKATKQKEENKKICEKEVLRLQAHYAAIFDKFRNIKTSYEKALKDNLESKNAEVSKLISHLEEKQKSALRRVNYIKEEGNTMTDIVLLKTHRKLTKLLSDENMPTVNTLYSWRHKSGKINESALKSMIGETVETESIAVTDMHSFQCGHNQISFVEAINEDMCLVRNTADQHVEF